MYNTTNHTYNFKRHEITFNNPYEKYYLLIYEDRDKYQSLVNIIYFNRHFNSWQCLYSEVLPYTGIRYYNQRWNLINNNALVLYSEPMGSGRFISYEVLGLENERIVKYISRETIFEGSIFFKNYELIEGMGNQFRVWEKENGDFILKPYKIKPYPGAYVIKYSILDENTVEIKKDKYSIPVGGVIQLIREDFNDISDKMLFSNPQNCLKFIQMATFKITCKSNTKITIVPGGYNWDKSKDIEITTS